MIKIKTTEERKLSELLANNQKYHLYLKNALGKVQSSDDFSEIQDILDRYTNLKSTNEDLLQQIQANTVEHEARRFSYAQFMKKSGNEMLNMNNEIARLQKEFEQVTIASNKMESLDHGTCQNVNELRTEISQALLVIDNMVERLEYHAHPSLPKTPQSTKTDYKEEGLDIKVKNAVEKLDRIADLSVDYEGIANDWDSNLS